MFRHILLASDGSKYACRAAINAVELARTFGAQLTLIHVCPAPFLREHPSDARREINEKHGNDVLAAIVQRAGEAGVPCHTIMEHGHPVEKIVQTARKVGADLIALGGRGAGGVKTLLLDSVSDGVTHQAHCPVLIVRGNHSAPCDPLFQNVLVGSDGSQCALKAAEVAAIVAKKYSARLTIVNVFQIPLYADPYSPVSFYGVSDTVVDQIQETAVGSAADVAESHDHPCCRRKEAGYPEIEIVRLADEESCDLIVLGSRGMSSLRAFLFGCVSDRVAHRAHCPVLIVK
ncbi:MAG: Universal stress protein family [Capsulimonas sp.]|nr:Universal stress protein family [Capsulimonas sp.]